MTTSRSSGTKKASAEAVKAHFFPSGFEMRGAS
jgi:hypothetical protein